MSEAAENLWNHQILEHEAWLRTVVRSRIAAPDEVDDVMQTVIADALAWSDRQHEIRAVGPWLYRLAVNAVLQFRRRCGRRRRLHDAYASDSPSLGSVEPLDLILGVERRQLVQDSLSGMSGEDVEILLLKYVHGWGYEQISLHLGLEGQRVAHRIRRARGRLKQQLHRRGLAAEGE